MKKLLIGFLALISVSTFAKTNDCQLTVGDIEELSLSFSESLDKAYYFNNSETHTLGCRKSQGSIVCTESSNTISLIVSKLGTAAVVETLAKDKEVVNQFKCVR